MAGRELPAVPSNMGLVDVAAVFARYWPGGKPSREALALVLAKSALETGRWQSMIDFNFGGVKDLKGTRDHTYFWTAECLSEAQAESMIRASTPQAPAKKAKSQEGCAPGQVRIMVGPRHPWARFRAFETAEAGARDSLGFLSKNARAWEVLTTTADATAFVRALKAANYFTGSEDSYRANVASMQREFLAKLPPVIPDVDAVPPQRLALPGIPPNVATAPVPSVAPSPRPPATRGYGEALAFALVIGAAIAAVNAGGGFRVPAFARAR